MICRATTSTGITPRKKAIPARQSLQKHEPLQVTRGIGTAICDTEGRVITLEYDSFYLVTCYTPNSQNELARLPYRMEWEDDFRALSSSARQQNAGHSLRRFKCCTHGDRSEKSKDQPQKCRFSDEEREKMTELLNAGFTDTFRYFFIRMPRAFIPGGPTALKPARKTPDGGSIISSLPDGWIPVSPEQLSIPDLYLVVLSPLPRGGGGFQIKDANDITVVQDIVPPQMNIHTVFSPCLLFA